jgi:hypothetical protein
MGWVFPRPDGIWAENSATRHVKARPITLGGQIQKIGGYPCVSSGNLIDLGFKPGWIQHDERILNDELPAFSEHR